MSPSKPLPCAPKCPLCGESAVDCQCFAEACDCPYNATGTFKMEIFTAITAKLEEAWSAGHHCGITDNGERYGCPNPYTPKEDHNE